MSSSIIDPLTTPVNIIQRPLFVDFRILPEDSNVESSNMTSLESGLVYLQLDTAATINVPEVENLLNRSEITLSDHRFHCQATSPEGLFPSENRHFPCPSGTTSVSFTTRDAMLSDEESRLIRSGWKPLSFTALCCRQGNSLALGCLSFLVSHQHGSRHSNRRVGSNQNADDQGEGESPQNLAAENIKR